MAIVRINGLFGVSVWYMKYWPRPGTAGRLYERAPLPCQSQTVDWPSGRPCSGLSVDY